MAGGRGRKKTARRVSLSPPRRRGRPRAAVVEESDEVQQPIPIVPPVQPVPPAQPAQVLHQPFPQHYARMSEILFDGTSDALDFIRIMGARTRIGFTDFQKVHAAECNLRGAAT